MDVHDLADRLYDRVAARLGDVGRVQINSLMAQDTPAAAVGLVCNALDNNDLTPDEVSAAIELAQDNQFRESSAWLLGKLTEHQNVRAATSALR